LTESENEIIINVLAENKKNSNSYRINAYLPSTSGTKLSNLTFSNGNLYPDFSSEVYSYTLFLDYGIDTVKITPLVENPETSIEITLNGSPIDSTDNMSLLSGDNDIEIKLKNPNNSSSTTYAINAYQSLTSNPYIELSDLFVTGGKLSSSFSPDIENYDLQLDYEVSSITITPVARDPRANVSIKINGTSVYLDDPISLDIGENKIAINVISFNSSSYKNYTISVYYTTAKLSYLSFSSGNLDPNFSSETYSYDLYVDENVNYINSSLTAQDASSSISSEFKNNSFNLEDQIPLDLGKNEISITVTAPESYDIKTYIVNAYKISTKLDSLTFSASGTLDPAFNSDIYEYTFSLEKTILDLVITPITKSSEATAQIIFKENYRPTTSPIDLDVGDNDFTIKVSNENISQVSSYSLNVRKPPKIFDASSTITFVKPSNPGNDYEFGSSLDISENTIVTGSCEEENQKGAVYIFTKETDEWIQKARLQASNTENGDLFGKSIAISGDTLVVGAPQEDGNYTGVFNGTEVSGSDDGSHENSGAAYVFVRNGNIWTQQAYLKAANTDAFDKFGISVAIDGNTIVVGADNERSNCKEVINGSHFCGTNDGNHYASGAAYVFIRNDNTWTQQAYLKAHNSDELDYFGRSLAISGNAIIVGALGEGGLAGATYIFERNGNTWTQQAYLKATETQYFGLSVDIDDNIAVVGSFSPEKVYMFIRNNETWSQGPTIESPYTDNYDQFGFSVAIKKGCLVVGAKFEEGNSVRIDGDPSNNSSSDSGAAYIFFRDQDDSWTQTHYLKATNTGTEDNFGSAIALSDNYTIVVGALKEDSNSTGINGDNNDDLTNSGAVYIYE